MTETPSQYLIRAAQHLYHLAQHYKEHYVNRPLDPADTLTSEETWVSDTVAPDASSQARRWVETINPSMTTAWACLLQEKAHELRDAKTFADKACAGQSVFEVAALILRNVPEPEEKPGLPGTPSWMPSPPPRQEG